MAEEHSSGPIEGDVSDPEATQEAISRQQLLEQLDTAAQEQKAFNAERMAALRAAQERSRPDYADTERRIADIENIPQPKFQKPPTPPNTQEMMKPTSLQRTFGMASIFALMSIGLAKGSGIYALKAFGGFMEGMHQGNIENAKAALEDFNSNMDVVKQGNDIAQKEYSNIFASKKYSLDQKERLFHMKALELNDELAIQQQAQGGMNAVHSYLKEKATISHQWALEALRYKQIEAQLNRTTGGGTGKLTSPQMNFQFAMRRLGLSPDTPISSLTPDQVRQVQEIMLTNGVAAPDTTGAASTETTPTPSKSGRNEDVLKNVSPNIAALVRKMADYDLPISGFGGLDPKTRSIVLPLVSRYDPTFDASKYPLKMQLNKEYSTAGPTGQNILAINTMTHHIDQFAEAYDRLNNSQIQLWNSSKNKLAANFGDPALVQVQAASKAISDEMARILKGGRAAPTEQEMASWESLYGTNLSKAQLRGVVWQSMKIAGGRLQSIESAYEQEMGKPKGALWPDSRERILKYKPKSEPTPKWLTPTLTRERLDAETENQLKETKRVLEGSSLPPAYPRAKNPKTGEVLIFKDGRWQPETK